MAATASYIELRPNRAGEPQAYIVGTRIRVQDIVADYELHGFSPGQIVQEHPHLFLGQVHAALSYYFDHQDLVRAQMRADDEFAQKMANAPTDAQG